MDYFHDGVLLRSFEVAYLLMVINVAVSAVNSTPACPPLSPASMQLRIMSSLTALHACSMIVVIAGARNNARSVLSDSASVQVLLPSTVGLKHDGTDYKDVSAQ